MLLPSTTASKCQIYNFTDFTSQRSPPLLPRKATQTSPKSHRSIMNSLKSSAKRNRINYQRHRPYDHTIPLQKATRTSINISFATHSHQRRLLFSLSRNLMDYYIYVLI